MDFFESSFEKGVSSCGNVILGGIRLHPTTLTLMGWLIQLAIKWKDLEVHRPTGSTKSLHSWQVGNGRHSRPAVCGYLLTSIRSFFLTC